MTFTCGSLFTGIGGIDLAFASAGCDILFQVEIDAYCTKVLEKHHDRYWPHATRFTDVREVGGHNLPRVDILFGGFPCQDISVAGKGMGIQEGTRSGLWFEFARIIGELRPRVVLLENVANILTRDGTIVIANLAQMGYVGHWGIVSAADAGAPHQRERWFCVAYRTGDQRHLRLQLGSNGRAHQTKQIGVGYPALVNASSQRAGSQRTGASLECRLGGNTDGLSDWLDRPRWPARPGQEQFAWEPPRVVSGQPNRTARLKSLGNAVVPAVVYPIACEIVTWLEAQAREEGVA
jgi:DNA (cytosine-5)-methyltransferase 1